MVLKVVWFGNNAYSLVITIQNTFELPVEAMKPVHFMLNHPKNLLIFVGDLVLNCRYGQVAFWQFLSIIMLLGFEFWSKGIFWISSWKGANINLDSQLLKWILEVGYVMSFIHKVFVFSALFFWICGPEVKGFSFPTLDLLFYIFSGDPSDKSGVFVSKWSIACALINSTVTKVS